MNLKVKILLAIGGISLVCVVWFRQDSITSVVHKSTLKQWKHSQSDHQHFQNMATRALGTDYPSEARELVDIFTDLMKYEGDWKVEKEDSSKNAAVHSTTKFPRINRKVFRLKTELDIGPKRAWEIILDDIENSPKWNPTIKELKKLRPVNENTDIVYQVTPEAGGGIVSCRDFINLRHWEERDGSYLSLVNATVCSDMPPQKKYIRGENGPGGMVFGPIAGNPDKCTFMWYLNSDMKGWLPKAAIDIGLTSVLFDYLGFFRKHIEEVKAKSG